MTIGALAKTMGLERTTLTRNLALLEAARWVSVHPGDDPRSREVAMTATGRRKVDAAYPAWRAAQAAASGMLGSGAAALRGLSVKATK